jgi:uracil-DNA glycosylase family 4
MTKSDAARALAAIQRAIPNCERCPELREYCAEVARTKRRAYRDFEYWGRPVPGFGDPGARILIAGLAPGAHGANRTGRMFTGDRSGDFLYAGLHRAGLASQPEATTRDDGLELRGVFIGAACRCAPPANKPTAAQLANCASYLADEVSILEPAVILCLGGIAWNAVLRVLREHGHEIPRPRPSFAHGAEVPLGDATLLGCYHVSQQNTFTGRLTEQMLDDVLTRAKHIANVH